MSGPKLMRYIGDADPNLGYVPQAILETFPSCRIVFLHRDLEQCVESEFNALTWENIPGCDEVTKDSLREAFRHVSWGISHLWKNLPDTRKLMVPYDFLEKEGIVRAIWDFCLPNTPFNEPRYRLLRDLRVTQIMANRYNRNPAVPFKKMIDQSHATVLENRTTEPCRA
jgi:hypothetical protein